MLNLSERLSIKRSIALRHIIQHNGMREHMRDVAGSRLGLMDQLRYFIGLQKGILNWLSGMMGILTRKRLPV